MKDTEITFVEVAAGMGLWKAMRGKAYLGMIARHADAVYVPTSGGIVYKKAADLETAKTILREAIDGG
jgi:hypothetical protein